MRITKVLLVCNLIALSNMNLIDNKSIQEEQNIDNVEIVETLNVEEITEEIIEEEVVVEEVKKAYEVCDSDKELIIKLVYLEARGEPYEGKKAVASIVFNRLESGHWGNTIYDVIYAKGQFTPAKQISSLNITDNKTWNECIKAVEDVIDNGNIFPKYILYFRADYYFSWAISYKSIGTHYFSYLKKDYDNLR